MLKYLGLLMLKASSYTWPSVSVFHSHIAKLIELGRLGWMSYEGIKDNAVTCFKLFTITINH